MKVALVHDWLTGMRGGEKCLEAFCELFPEADIYTLLHQPGSVSETIEKHSIRTSFLQSIPFIVKCYRYFLPLFPMAIQSFDLSKYDLVISSSHCVAKGVKVGPGVCHISYVHTPMRYIWDQYHVYFRRNGYSSLLEHLGMRVLRPWLKRWDVFSNKGIFAYSANSWNVADRIKRFYKQRVKVIYPPVDFNSFSVSKKEEGFYLMVTALVPYKRVDLAIEAFNQLEQPLRIIGAGPEEKKLKAIAKKNVEFMGKTSHSEIIDAYQTCRAVIFPGEEDFGIVPLEAMACGKPVIAYGRGGVVETVVPMNGVEKYPPTGVFFREQTPDSVINAVRFFESNRDNFEPEKIRDHVRPFDRQQFKEKFYKYTMLKYQEFKEAQHAKKVQ